MVLQPHRLFKKGVNLLKWIVAKIYLQDFRSQCLKIINKETKHSNIKVAYLRNILEKATRSQERRILHRKLENLGLNDKTINKLIRKNWSVKNKKRKLKKHNQQDLEKSWKINNFVINKKSINYILKKKIEIIGKKKV